MFFDRMKPDNSKQSVSPGSIGGKIKRYRELNKWSQKKLGLQCGFSESTADVRIAQYEKNKTLPRERAIKDIATALDIDEHTLFDADMNNPLIMYHALFDMEDFHGLHPIKRGDEYFLRFGNPIDTEHESMEWTDYSEFLEAWYKTRQKYMPSDDDSEKDKEAKSKAYTLWRAKYSGIDGQLRGESSSDKLKLQQLQAEMDTINAKMKSDEELQKIEALVRNANEKATFANKLSLESEFIILIKELITDGLNIEKQSKGMMPQIDYVNYCHLLSIKTGDLYCDSQKQVLFCKLMSAIDDIKQCGIEILSRISCRNNELYITYFIPYAYLDYFSNLINNWNLMMDVVDAEQQGSLSENDWLVEEFNSKISGKHDVSFLDPDKIIS